MAHRVPDIRVMWGKGPGLRNLASRLPYNLIALLKGGVRHAEAHRAEARAWLRMEFATFRAAVIEMPCQIVRGGGRLIYRLQSWNPWQGVFLRLVERLHGRWLY